MFFDATKIAHSFESGKFWSRKRTIRSEKKNMQLPKSAIIKDFNP